MRFQQIDLKNFDIKPFSLLKNNWALLAAGTLQKHNSMTISWGGFGILFHKSVATVYVRPQRFTKIFMDSCPYFSLNFFDEEHKHVLQFYGTYSGKTVDKDLETGFKVQEFQNTVGYEQAQLILICKKQFVSQMDKKNFVDDSLIKTFYSSNDFHYIYIGEIVAGFIKN